MRSWFVHVLGLTACLLGCEAESRPAAPDGGRKLPDADVALQADAASELRDAGPVAPRQMKSGCDVSQCERQAAELARELTTPAEVALSVQGGDCARVDIVGVVAGMACTCQSSNGWIYIGPEGAGCFARGRAGDCLWDDSEFNGCIQGDPACSAMCDELARRYAADAANSFEVEVRYSTCYDDSCHHVLRIEDACYADYSFESGRRFSCELSDSEIIEREVGARAAP